MTGFLWGKKHKLYNWRAGGGVYPAKRMKETQAVLGWSRTMSVEKLAWSRHAISWFGILSFDISIPIITREYVLQQLGSLKYLKGTNIFFFFFSPART